MVTFVLVNPFPTFLPELLFPRGVWGGEAPAGSGGARGFGVAVVVGVGSRAVGFGRGATASGGLRGCPPAEMLGAIALWAGGKPRGFARTT